MQDANPKPTTTAVLRRFRRQYLLARQIYPEGMLSLQVDQTQDQGSSALGLPPAELEYASVMRPFLDPNSPLYVPNVWERLNAEHPLPPSDVADIEQALERLRTGAMPIHFNNTMMNAEAIYHLVADGELFNDDPAAAKALEDFTIGPSRNLFRMIAHNYMHDMTQLLPILYELIKHLPEQEAPLIATPKCIYCLSTTNAFTSEEHVLPESLAGETIVLPKGVVCDPCNNGILATLDHQLMEFPPVKFLRTLFVPHTKAGKYPIARFPNFHLKRTGPRSVQIKVMGKDPITTHDDGTFSLAWRDQRRLDLHTLARSLVRTGLGVLAHDVGIARACHEDFTAARAFIHGGNTYQGWLAIETTTKPEPAIMLHVIDNPTQTWLFAALFGIKFAINLQPQDALTSAEPPPPTVLLVDLSK
ncbi:MAG: HNH endonuclease [Acidobacteriota bacterium]|nr:HNH endonuclease [Acidobacteriota bacterium]